MMCAWLRKMKKLYRLIAKYFQLLIQMCELHYSHFLVGGGRIH